MIDCNRTAELMQAFSLAEQSVEQVEIPDNVCCTRKRITKFRVPTSRALTAEELLTPNSSTRAEAHIRGSADEISAQTVTVSEAEDIKEKEIRESEAILDPEVTVISAPTAAKIAAKEVMVTDENDLNHRKRGHEATSVNGTQQDESESSSTEPEAIGKTVVAFSSGNLLGKQIKRLRSTNKKATK